VFAAGVSLIDLVFCGADVTLPEKVVVTDFHFHRLSQEIVHGDCGVVTQGVTVAYLVFQKSLPSRLISSHPLASSFYIEVGPLRSS